MPSSEPLGGGSGPIDSPGGTSDRNPAGVNVDEPVASPRQRPLVARVARVVVGGAVVGLCAVLVWWWAIGGKWEIVRTPSMGTYAPVGTLLWVKPANLRDIHLGQVITYRSSYDSQTFTHRVVGRNRDGTLVTKGDINAADDPGYVDQQHLVGRVEVRWIGAGWLVRALPLLLLGGLGWWVLTGLFASRRSRAPLRVLGAAIFIAVAIGVYNPFFGATKLSFVSLGPPGAKATYVGTGLLPAKLQSTGTPSVLVPTGHVRSIVATHMDKDRYSVTVSRTTPWWVWAIVAAGSFAPAVWSVIVGVDPMPPGPPRRWQRRHPQHAHTATA